MAYAFKLDSVAITAMWFVALVAAFTSARYFLHPPQVVKQYRALFNACDVPASTQQMIMGGNTGQHTAIVKNQKPKTASVLRHLLTLGIR